MAQYDRMWRQFRLFTGEESAPGTMDAQIERYLIELHESGRGAQAPAFLSAARFQLLGRGGLGDAQRLDAIAAGAHRQARLLSRDLGSQRAPLTGELIERMEQAMPPCDPGATMDKAVLRLGHALVLRGGELGALLREDVSFDGSDTMEVAVRREKTRALLAKDVHVFRDPGLLRAVRNYLAQRGDAPGLLFRSPGGGALTTRGISAMLRRRLEDAGVDPARYTSHSLRIGGATDLAQAGASMLVLAAHGGWSPHSDSVQRYVRAVPR